MERVTVQALRDVQLLDHFPTGERRELSKAVAQLLVAKGAVKLINKPGRPKAKPKEA